MYGLHIGAPKTGTTSLQDALSSLGDELVRYNVRYLNTGEFQRSDIGQFLRGKVEQPKETVVALRDSITSGVRILLSDEGMTGPLMNPSKSGWRNVASRAFLFADIVAELPEKVAITIRRQDHYIRSCYLHRLRHGRIDLDFEAFWSSEIEIGSLKWSVVLREIETYFGRDRVVVLLYEDMGLDFHDFLHNFLYRTMGVQLDVSKIKVKYHNRSLSEEQARIIIQRVQALKTTGMGNKSLKANICALIEKEKNISPFGSVDPRLYERMREELKTDNEIVIRRYGLNPNSDFLFK